MSETNRDPAQDATAPARDDAFTLYDLRVEVMATDRPMVCNHQAGDSFTLRGENLAFPAGQTFPLYPLAALLAAGRWTWHRRPRGGDRRHDGLRRVGHHGLRLC